MHEENTLYLLMRITGKWKSRHLTVKRVFKSNTYEKFLKTKEMQRKYAIMYFKICYKNSIYTYKKECINITTTNR